MSGAWRLDLWAPNAASVEVVWEPAPSSGAPGSIPGFPGHPENLGRRTRSLHPTGEGWWRWEPTGDDAGAGTAFAIDYGIVLDGVQPPIPDPRSAWQPDGVHGPSRTFDVDAFAWTDTDWAGVQAGRGLLGGVVYELHVGTFTAQGTLDAAVDRLDHLVALGVDLVELMPVAPFPGDRGWGYDGVGPYAVHETYGGPMALQRFVDAAHARGLGVCLDVVHNHLGPSGNYLSRFGPYFTDRRRTPWGPALNLDGPSSAPVRAYLIESALRWFEDFHVDALRLDAVHELHDASQRHYLEELSDAVAARSARLGRPLELIAESDLNDVTMVRPTAQGGLGMTAQWDDDVHHALHVALTGERQGYYADFAGGPGRDEQGPLEVLARVFTRGFLHDGGYSSFRDAPWGVSIDRETFDARRLVASLQTHDQVGNRALGDRLQATLTPGEHAIGAALLLFGPFTPMLFMGEEWAATTPWQFFTSFEEDGLAHAVSTGRRAEFARHGWPADAVPDPQDPATRDHSVLRWAEPEHQPHSDVLAWYAACIRLRRDLLGESPTRLTDITVAYDEGARWVVLRQDQPGRTAFAVVANLADEPQRIPFSDSGEVMLVQGMVYPSPDGGWQAGAHSVAVLSLA